MGMQAIMVPQKMDKLGHRQLKAFLSREIKNNKSLFYPFKRSQNTRGINGLQEQCRTAKFWEHFRVSYS